MLRYWMGVASKEHVLNGVKGGFAQVCHGKAYPLKQMREGDWIIYYSPTLQFGEKEPCQSFTAIGKIAGNAVYPFAMSADFIPWRRDVSFVKTREAPIHSLINQLNFIVDKQKWGFPFRRGCFEIQEEDFLRIAEAMGLNEEDQF